MLTTVRYFDNLKFDIFMQVFINAALTCLLATACWEISICPLDTSVKNNLLDFSFLPFFHWQVVF